MISLSVVYCAGELTSSLGRTLAPGMPGRGFF